MNQILFTGDEGPEKNQNFKVKQKEPKAPKFKPKKNEVPNFKSFRADYNSNSMNYNTNQVNYNSNYTSKKIVDIKKIVIFFSISIIILGFCLIGGSIYAKDQINDEVEANATPLVNVTRNDENNTLDITVSHIRGIQQITYQWNDGEEQILNENNQKNVTETIDLMGGKNILTITVTEENGQTVRYQKEYSVGNVPTITLENVDNGVKIIAYAEDTINNIKYSWDDGEATTIEVGEKNYEGVINAPKGRHSLKIIVTDEEGIPAEKTTTVIGATVPVIEAKLGRKNGEIYFVINVEDEEQLKNVKITLNDEEVENVQVNDKTYYVEVKALDGENRLVIEAENNNGLKTTERKSLDTSTLN